MPTEIKDTYAETWWFSSEGTMMYPVGKMLIVPLRALGVTPNMITIANIFVGAATVWQMANLNMLPTLALTYLHQLLDAMDGTMARRYKLGSQFGAKLDEYTDISFGISLTLAACVSVYPNLYAVAGQVAFSCFALYGAVCWSAAKNDPKRQTKFVEDLSFWEIVGLWGVESMTYNMLINVFFIYLARTSDEAAGMAHLEVSPWWMGASIAISFIGVACAERETHHFGLL